MAGKSSKKMVRTSVILPQDKRLLLEQIADVNGASVAWVIRHAIKEFIKNNKNNKELKLKTTKKE